MWAIFLLGLLVGATASKDQDVWKFRMLYEYDVEQRSLTGLDQVHNQYSGFVCRSNLQAVLRNESTISFTMKNYLCASIQANFSNGWEGPLPKDLQWDKVEIGSESFQARYENGVIRNVSFEGHVPAWERNVKKALVSSFQIDSRGTELIRRPDNEKPDGISAVYSVMESSVLGTYETVYDMSPDPRYFSLRQPQDVLEKFLSLRGDIIQISKALNLTHGKERLAYNYGVDAGINWEPVKNRMGDAVSHHVQTDVLGVGSQDQYTILSVKGVQKISVAPDFYQEQSGVIGSSVRLVLKNYIPSFGIPPQQKNPEVEGLEYTPLVRAEPRKEKRGLRGLSLGGSGRLDFEVGRRNPDKEDHVRKQTRPPYDSYEASDSSDDLQRKRERFTRSIAMKNLKKQALQDDDSSSSSSSSNSDEVEFEPLPLHAGQALYLPFSPYAAFFSGNTKDTKSLALFPWIVSEARRIAEEIQSPESIPHKGTLARFNNMIQVLRSAHPAELRQAADKLYYVAPQNPSEREELFYLSWVIYANSLAMVGSPDSFILVNDLVRERKLTGHRGGFVLALAAHHIRIPSQIYLDTMWKTVQDTSLDFKVRRKAIMAFGDMVRNTIVDKRNIHNHFPVHMYGNQTINSLEMLQKYTKYFQDQLKIAVAEGNGTIILYWMRGLGNMGHADVLRVLRVYIDGTEYVTDLQRFIAVKALDYMSIINPNISIPFLINLHQSLGNSHDVRCQAVNHLGQLYLSNSIMQQMAAFTNKDQNNEVNAAVKSLLESKASLKSPEYKEVARGAQAAISLLNPKTYSTHYSMSKHYSNIVERTGLSYDLIVNMIGSEDSILHQAFDLSLFRKHGGVRTVVSKIFGMVSSQSVFQTFLKNRFIHRSVNGVEEDRKNHFPVKTGIPEELEAVFNLKTAHFPNLMIAENNCTLETRIKDLKRELQQLKSGKAYNFTQIVNVAPVAVGMPSLLGMPVRFTFNEPSVISVRAKAIVGTNPDASRDPQSKIFLIPDNVNVAMKIKLLYSRSKLAVSEIFVPYNGKVYTSGLQTKMHINLPLNVSVKWDIENNIINTTLAPISAEKDLPIAHVSSIPYTTVRDIWSLTAPELSPKLQIVHVRQPRWTNTTFGSDTTGMAFRVEYKSEIEFQDGLWREERNKRFDPIARAVFPQASTTIYHYNVTLFFDKKSQATNASFQFAYGSEQLGEKQGRTRFPRSHRHSKRVRVQESSEEESDVELNAGEGISNGTKTWISWSVVFQPSGGNYSLNASLTASPISPLKKARIVYLSRNINQKTPENTTLALVLREELSPEFSYKDILNANHNATLLMTLNSTNSHAEAKIKLLQSHRYLQSVKDSGLGKLCEKQMENEDFVLHACRNASAEAMYRDKYEVEARYKLSPEARNTTRQLLREVVHILHRYADINAVNVSNTNGTLNASLWFSSEWNTLNASVSVADYAVNFTNVRTVPYVSRVIASHQSYNIYQRWQGYRTNGKDMPTCRVDSNFVTTFDNSTYATKIPSCWVVLFTTSYSYPTTDCNEEFEQLGKYDRNITILAATRGGRVIYMMVGNQKIEMDRSGLLPGRIDIRVNGKSIPLSSNNVTQVNGTDKHILLIAYPKPDGSVVVTFPREELTVQFNGRQVLVRASDIHRAASRGLCGTLDGEWVTDFTTKDDCVLGDPRLFVASYVHNVSVCQDKEVLQAVEEAKKAPCYAKTVIKNTLLGGETRNLNSQKLRERVRQGGSSESSESSDSSSSSESSQSSENSENSSSSDSSSSNDDDSQGASSNSDSNSSSSSSSSEENGQSTDDSSSSSSSSSSEEQQKQQQQQQHQQQQQQEHQRQPPSGRQRPWERRRFPSRA